MKLPAIMRAAAAAVPVLLPGACGRPGADKNQAAAKGGANGDAAAKTYVAPG